MLGSVLPAMAPVQAQQSLTQDQFTKLLPPPLSDKNFNTVKNIAESNAQVQKIINGRTHEFMAQDFVGNVYANPVIWNPEIHINIANTTEVTAVVDLGTHTVKSIQTMPLIKSIPPRRLHQADSSSTAGPAFAVDYYNGGTSIDGIQMYSYAPSHTSSSTIDSTDMFLLNAEESYANNNNACTSSLYPSDYFAQVGFSFQTGPSVSHNGYIMWTDTQQSCNVVGLNIAYNIGDLWDFTIQVVNSNWVISGYDEYTGDSFSYTRSGMNYLTMQTDNTNTSTFFENQNSGTNWANLFSSNPSATSATYHEVGGTWTNWASDSKVDLDCHQDPPTTDTSIISGNLASGDTADWSVQNMASDLPGC
jgi:hypothetical protein